MRNKPVLSKDEALEHRALNAVSRGTMSVEVFRKLYCDMLLEGFKSKGYVRVQYDVINVLLPGVKRLLDLEGLPYV